MSLSTPALLAPLVPLSWLAASIGLYAVALQYRSFRWLLLGPLLYCDWHSFAASKLWSGLGVDSAWALLMAVWVSHTLSMLFLENGSLAIDGRGPLNEQTWWCKFWATWNNVRLLQTSKATHPIPAPLSRLMFTILRCSKLIIYLLFNKFILPNILPFFFSPLSLSDFDSTRQTFCRRLLSAHGDPITVREVQMRLVFAILWALPTYIVIDGAHAALSLLFVTVLRANRPEEWPPIYGNFREAYTLRGFWGKFWHKLVVLPYGSLGTFVARRCIGLRAKAQLHNMVVACFIFVLSGAAHAATAWQLGDEECWHLDIWWFFLNFLATAAENLILFAPRTKSSSSSNSQPSIWRRVIGYFTVFLFFFWSVPKWQYPKMYHMILTVIKSR